MKLYRIMLYVSLVAFAARMGLLDDAPKYVSVNIPPLTLGEFTVWAGAWFALAELGLAKAPHLTKIVLGIGSWIIANITLTLWAMKIGANPTALALMLAFIWAGSFLPLTDITPWRPHWHLRIHRHRHP